MKKNVVNREAYLVVDDTFSHEYNVFLEFYDDGLVLGRIFRSNNGSWTNPKECIMTIKYTAQLNFKFSKINKKMPICDVVPMHILMDFILRRTDSYTFFKINFLDISPVGVDDNE